jgi:hypothetical protein
VEAFLVPKMLPWPALQLPCWQFWMMVLIPLPMVSARPGPTVASTSNPSLSESPIGRLAVTPTPKLVATDVPITRADDPLIPGRPAPRWPDVLKYLRKAYSNPENCPTPA